MDNHQTGAADWAIPAVLVALGVGLYFALGLALGLAFVVAAEDRAEAPQLIQDLDAYTKCLVDHGADVPRVNVGKDGGSTVSVPGSVVDGEFDESAWRRAAEQCGVVAPNLFAGMLGGFSGDWFEIIPEEFFASTVSVEGFVEIDEFDVDEFLGHPRTRRPGADAPQEREALLDDLERRCERLAEGKDLIARLSGPESTTSAGSASASIVDVALGADAPYPQRSEAMHHPVVFERPEHSGFTNRSGCVILNCFPLCGASRSRNGWSA